MTGYGKYSYMVKIFTIFIIIKIEFLLCPKKVR